MKRMTEHKLAVGRGDTNNGTAVHAWDAQHLVDWEGAKIRLNHTYGREESSRSSTSRPKETTTWTMDYKSATYGTLSLNRTLSLLTRYIPESPVIPYIAPLICDCL